MRHKLILQRILVSLIAAAVMLLIGVTVTLGLGELLAAMGDRPGSIVLQYIALAGGGLCVLDLICLILLVAVNSLLDPDEPPTKQ